MPLLNKSWYVAGCWDDSVLKTAPAYLVIKEISYKRIVLALRGTKLLDDLLTDLTSQFVTWRNGFAHRGFVKSLKQLEPLVKDTIVQLMKENPDYSLVLCGHSLGAAISALLVLKWHDEFPEWNIHGYGYATPCCVSKHLLDEGKALFTTFVHNFDAVSRLSMGSVQDLHNGFRLFSRRVGPNGSKVLPLYYALKKLTFNASNTKILATAAEINSIINLQVGTERLMQTPTSHLFPLGTIYQLWREKRGKKFTAWELYEVSFHPTSPFFFNFIPIYYLFISYLFFIQCQFWQILFLFIFY